MANLEQVSLQVGSAEIQIGYRRSGRGRPVLLIHGLGGAASCWRRQEEAMGGDHELFAIDLPGSGRSPSGEGVQHSGPWSVSLVSSFVEQVIRSRTILVGHSMGGAIALMAALDRPQLVDSLVLVAPAGFSATLPWSLRALCLPGVPRAMEAIGPRLFTHASRQIEAWFKRGLVGMDSDLVGPMLKEALAHYRQREAVRAFLSSLRAGAGPRGQELRRQLRRRFRELNMPVLVVWGGSDRVLPVEHSLTLLQKPPGAEVVIMKGCGHSPHLEAPALFSEHLGDFLQRAPNLVSAGSAPWQQLSALPA